MLTNPTAPPSPINKNIEMSNSSEYTNPTGIDQINLLKLIPRFRDMEPPIWVLTRGMIRIANVENIRNSNTGVPPEISSATVAVRNNISDINTDMIGNRGVDSLDSLEDASTSCFETPSFSSVPQSGQKLTSSEISLPQDEQ